MLAARPAATPSTGQNEGMAGMSRFWIAMQIIIIVCVLISAVIVVVKL